MTEPEHHKGDGALDAAVTQPFLRITGTYPAADGREETVCLEMNLTGDVSLGDDDEVAEGGVKSWFTDFCTCVIASLRRGRGPSTVVMTGPAMKLLADRVQHAEDCDGSCGTILPTKPADPGVDLREANGDAAPADQTGGA